MTGIKLKQGQKVYHQTVTDTNAIDVNLDTEVSDLLNLLARRDGQLINIEYSADGTKAFIIFVL